MKRLRIVLILALCSAALFAQRQASADRAGIQGNGYVEVATLTSVEEAP